MRILFIRHGQTAGNQKKRYIGRTDEPLCPDGIRRLGRRVYEPADVVICSPMLRCRQTAQLLYPDRKPLVYENLRECDFGEFEGKNYSELDGNENYQRWVDSKGALPFPGGESAEGFRERSVQAFLQAVREQKGRETVALVVHGGTIMAVLERLAVPKRDFYDYHVDNGMGFVADWNDDTHEIHILEKLG